jgi:4-diphosphocytidyl-2-C-methyl-D-erythritol kinase
MNSVTVNTPAKINLFLEVTGKRKDGYHNLLTLFAKIGIFDKLVLRKLSSNRSIKVWVKNNSNLKIGDQRKNIVHRAARLFFKTFKINAGVEIILTKNIPVGAGLGGGSSDAAGTLSGLCRLFRIQFRSNYPKIKKIGRMLGADVPFFLSDSTFCAGSGIGDRLSPITPPPERSRRPVGGNLWMAPEATCFGGGVKVKRNLPKIVVVFPCKGILTKKVYSKLHMPSKKSIRENVKCFNRLKNALKNGQGLSKFKNFLFNRLENPVFDNYKFVFDIKEKLSSVGMDAVLMAGSGSAIFALTENADNAKRIAQKVCGKKCRIFVTQFL